MFEVFCPQEKVRVLLSARNILEINNGANGVEVRYLCHCGHHGVLQTGRQVSFAAKQDGVEPVRKLQAA